MSENEPWAWPGDIPFCIISIAITPNGRAWADAEAWQSSKKAAWSALIATLAWWLTYFNTTVWSKQNLGSVEIVVH